MEELMVFVPPEIASHIIQYTYRFQESELLSDIVNYTKSKAILVFIYLTYFTIREQVNEYEPWLSNDIGHFMNDFHHTGVLYGGGYVDMFYTRLFRNPFLKTREQIDKYVINLGGIDSITKEINIYLGLLKIEERRELIEWVIQCYGLLWDGHLFLELI
jgi:hypothetical protein